MATKPAELLGGEREGGEARTSKTTGEMKMEGRASRIEALCVCVCVCESAKRLAYWSAQNRCFILL